MSGNGFCPKFDLYRKSNLFSYHYPAIKHHVVYKPDILVRTKKCCVSGYPALSSFLRTNFFMKEFGGFPRNSSFGHILCHTHKNILNKKNIYTTCRHYYKIM